MFAHVLVPIDGSFFSENALRYAATLAEHFGARLTLLHVLPTRAPREQGPNPKFFIQWQDEFDGEIKHYLEAQVERLTALGISVTFQLEESNDVADCVLQVAERKAPDIIVMSTHGRSGLGRWLLGSVADKVLRHAGIPVLLIRSSGKEKEDLLLTDT